MYENTYTHVYVHIFVNIIIAVIKNMNVHIKTAEYKKGLTPALTHAVLRSHAIRRFLYNCRK